MFNDITLELSLKPFKKTDEKYIRNVCEQIFTQWRPLLKNRERISVMLWTSDGSEILDYTADLDRSFEWCKYIGTANNDMLRDEEPKYTSLHKRKHLYIQNPPIITYRILKNIVSTIKEVGRTFYPESKISVGQTFDIGPEFAVSDFKYNRHREICSGSTLDSHGFVDCTAMLDSDDYPYAAYPQGIPQNTPFGTFLGKQAQIFLSDLGFDYIWLSNGLGFSSNPWDMTGKIFDGKRYYPEKLKATKAAVFDFWKLFTAECRFPIRTRGTNNTVGIDYATDGVPLYDIYNAGLDITPPPNSPWAAINDDYGLEMLGHMSRICHTPNGSFMFRYYIHDPWWVNSPWYDRYDGCASDIYLPMAISSIDEKGEIKNAEYFNILSIDNSYGDMPDCCVNEPLPHILKAEKDCSDEPAPLVLVYPLRHYTVTDNAALIKEMNDGDHFVIDAINSGLPLNCVVSADNILCHDASTYKNSVLIVPASVGDYTEEKLCKLAKEGVPVIRYGSYDMLCNTKTGKKVCIENGTDAFFGALAELGYEIEFIKKECGIKPPTMTIAKSDGAYIFSVYNSNTTTETALRFPLGAPILNLGETEIREGKAHYHFARGEHRECRVFVDQSNGVISCKEGAPVNAQYRRKIVIKGLKDATVYLFPEKDCKCAVADGSKGLDNWTDFVTEFKEVNDRKYGRYLKGEHINGSIFFMLERRTK